MRLKAYGNREDPPTGWEQDIAEMYVNKRQIVRPNTNIKTALCTVLLFALATGLFTWLAHFVFMSVGVFSYLPASVQDFHNTHPVLSIVIFCAIVMFTGALACLKYIAIGTIRLYQHYAPEEIRRRCLFMPTCSEYTIMSIRRHGVVVGFYKSYFRIMYRCKGNIYMIDYP